MAPADSDSRNVSENPVLDTAAFAEMCRARGDAAARRFVSGYEEMARYQLVATFRAAEARDWDAVRQSARDLEDGARKLGLLRLAGACAEIGRACAEDRIDRAICLLGDLQGQFLESLKAIRAHVDCGR